MKALLVDVMGVNVSTLVNAVEGLRLLGEGNTQRGLEKLSPKFVRDISKAQRYAHARMDGQGSVAKVLREIEAFNRVNRYAGITHKQLNHSIKRRMRLRAKKSGDAGLYIADRYQRQLMEMGYE